MNNNLHITIRRALTGLNLEGYEFVERKHNDNCVEYHLRDVVTSPGCQNCNSDNLLSKGFTQCKYRHFMESGIKSYIVVHKRKYACYECGSSISRNPIFASDNCRFTSPYVEHLSERMLMENIPMFSLSISEKIPLSTIRKLSKQIIDNKDNQ